jgi:MerR family transcriptional regulator, copper efflux regulator
MTRSADTPGPALRIGDVAGQTGVTVETLRYYEQRGLLRPMGRGRSGYREFPADSVRVVRFIKRAQALGFSLAEIEELVRLRERAWTGDAPRQLRQAAVAKVRDINRRVRELRALGRELTELIAACDVAGCVVDEVTSGNAIRETSRSVAAGALPCPLVEAFDAGVDPTEASVDKRRVRRRSKHSRNDPSIPGRRVIGKQ